MRTVTLFTNGSNQAVRIPKDMEFAGVHELEIHREGDVLILRPVRPDWLSFIEVEKADADWLQERPDIISDEGRFAWL
ncbi:MAG: type II toxin-antitoxin system VapB family antitoxin [Thiolinea sp.]